MVDPHLNVIIKYLSATRILNKSHNAIWRTYSGASRAGTYTQKTKRSISKLELFPKTKSKVVIDINSTGRLSIRKLGTAIETLTPFSGKNCSAPRLDVSRRVQNGETVVILPRNCNLVNGEGVGGWGGPNITRLRKRALGRYPFLQH